MNGTVLIVDDSLTVRMDLLEAFEAEGMRAAGAETLARARARLAKGDICVVVLDLLLPDGSGIDLVREIRATPSLAGTPILMLSSEAEVHDRIRGLAIGSDDYAGKPYERAYVVARARELAERRAAATGQGAASILVIDDSATFRDALRHALEERGYRVLVAVSGEDGLRSAAMHRPTAIVVDGQLPGIDGPTVIRKLRLDAALRQTPCVLLTGSSVDRAAELHALDAGADAFVRKDEDMEMILARVSAVIRAGASTDGDRSTASLMSPKKILAVDDSAAYLDALGELLRGEGYDVILARSGEDAIEMLGVQSVDCILLDRTMDGLDGLATCRRIKASASRDVPLIMLAASEERTAMIDGLDAGADDYVFKGAGELVLKARLQAQLRRKQIEDEARRVRVQLLSKELDAMEARAARDLAETRAALAEELERKNRDLLAANEELESFAYTVSHDLRAPLRGIDGFGLALQEDYADRLDEQGVDYLKRLRESAGRMNELIDDLLSLSKITRQEFQSTVADLSAIARRVADRIRGREPERAIEFLIADGLSATCDPRLIEAALENLFGNAWKFTGKRADARVEFGYDESPSPGCYFVRDNGAGFDMAQASRLFRPFQRLHHASEFEGTGIGLATVQRIVTRHGGRLWATGVVGEGATFRFTLGPATARE